MSTAIHTQIMGDDHCSALNLTAVDTTPILVLCCMALVAKAPAP